MMDSVVLDLFNENKLVNVCAPMVRYSKLAFRTLVRRYNCHLCFTPMIVADSFISSAKARCSEFTTNTGDRPLIVQFAAKDPYEFATAAEMVASYSDGVDLNCGCPQTWAMKDGYGAYLLQKPQLIRDLVLQVRNRISGPFAISVKLRILEDLNHSIDLCRMLEKVGVSFLTVHARTPHQKHQPINVDALREIKSSIQVPLIANGDVKTISDAEYLRKETGCDGVMAARGILTNPAMYAGYVTTPITCVEDWIAISMQTNATFQCFHHHLVFMLEKILPKSKRLLFNVLKDKDNIINFLSDCGITCNKEAYDLSSFSKIECEFYESEKQGKFFTEKINSVADDIDAEEYLGSSNLYFNDGLVENTEIKVEGYATNSVGIESLEP